MNKKVLIFIDWYKPGFKAGGPIRSISNIVDHLHHKTDFYIITSNLDYLSTVPYTGIEANTWIEVDNASVKYLSKDKINFSTIKNSIKEVTPDIVYCNSLYSFYFSLSPLFISKKRNIKTILAIRGMLSPGSLSIKNKKKRAFLTLIKTLQLFKNCTLHATSLSEYHDIQKEFSTNKIVTIQNLPEKKVMPFQNKDKEIGELKMVSIGRISPEKNTLYALKALENVTAKVSYDIYGPIYATEYWKKCQETINLLPSNIVVNYNGVLNHNKIDETLKKYHTLFLPSTGENFGHIIIEAMINSCIPIISDKTPWRNLEKDKIGFDIPLNDIKEYALIIDKLAIIDQENFNELSKNSHQYAFNIINDKKIIEDYHKLFQLNN